MIPKESFKEQFYASSGRQLGRYSFWLENLNSQISSKIKVCVPCTKSSSCEKIIFDLKERFGEIENYYIKNDIIYFNQSEENS